MPLPPPIVRLQHKLRGATPAPPEPQHGFALGPRQPTRLWRTLLRATLAVVLLVGLIDLLGGVTSRFAADPPAPAAVDAGLDEHAARQLAVAFTADYLSYDPAAADVRATALDRWAATEPPAWAGTYQLRADLVTAGPVAGDGDRLIVQTTARAHPAAPAGGETPAPLEVTWPRAADPGDRAGFTPVAPLWLTLDVAVADVDGQPQVTGATFTGDQPTALTAPPTESDPALTRDTATLGTDVFDALGSGDLAYITAPDVDLHGMGGATELREVTGWRVAVDTGDDRYRAATADVTWQLAGTDLAITQPYALRITQDDGRWLVAAIGTHPED